MTPNELEAYDAMMKDRDRWRDQACELRHALSELRRWVADGDCSDDAGIWPGFATTAYRDAVNRADEVLKSG